MGCSLFRHVNYTLKFNIYMLDAYLCVCYDLVNCISLQNLTSWRTL